MEYDYNYCIGHYTLTLPPSTKTNAHTSYKGYIDLRFQTITIENESDIQYVYGTTRIRRSVQGNVC